MSKKHTRMVECEVTITINDNAPADLFTRVTDPEWVKAFYPGINTESDVLSRFAELAVLGFENLRGADGWGDVDADAVWLSVDPISVDTR